MALISNLSATSVQQLCHSSWIMSGYIFAALPVSLCLTFRLDSLCASGPNAWKMLNLQFGQVLPKLIPLTLQENIQLSLNASKPLAAGVPELSTMITHLPNTFTHICWHTYTVEIFSYCKGFSLCLHQSHVCAFLFLSLCLSFCPSLIQKQLKSLQSGFKHVNYEGFQLQRWVHTPHTHTQ